MNDETWVLFYVAADGERKWVALGDSHPLIDAEVIMVYLSFEGAKNFFVGKVTHVSEVK